VSDELEMSEIWQEYEGMECGRKVKAKYSAARFQKKLCMYCYLKRLLGREINGV